MGLHCTMTLTVNDIWWPILKTCSNLFTWGHSQCWHRMAIEAHIVGKQAVCIPLECFLFTASKQKLWEGIVFTHVCLFVGGDNRSLCDVTSCLAAWSYVPSGGGLCAWSHVPSIGVSIMGGGGVSVQGDLCPGEEVSVQGRMFSVQGGSLWQWHPYI